MKIILLALSLVVGVAALAEPRIRVMPDLMKQVNSFTTDNEIPWYGFKSMDKQDCEFHIKASPSEFTSLVSTIHGDYNHLLIRMRYIPTEIIRGEFAEKELTFYIERSLPTKESGIKLKELWPFTRGRELSFWLKKTGDSYRIVSIER